MSHRLPISTDIAIAQYLSERIALMGNLDLSGLNVWSKPLGRFNGDIILCTQRSSGGIHLLLADFIVPGLSTAVVALAVADVFYGMTARSCYLSEVIEKINKKSLSILPQGMYGSACLMALDEEQKLLTI